MPLVLHLGLALLAAITNGTPGKPLFHTFMAHQGLLGGAELCLAAAGLADKVRRQVCLHSGLLMGPCVQFNPTTQPPTPPNHAEET